MGSGPHPGSKSGSLPAYCRRIRTGPGTEGRLHPASSGWTARRRPRARAPSAAPDSVRGLRFTTMSEPSCGGTCIRNLIRSSMTSCGCRRHRAVFSSNLTARILRWVAKHLDTVISACMRMAESKPRYTGYGALKSANCRQKVIPESGRSARFLRNRHRKRKSGLDGV